MFQLGLGGVLQAQAKRGGQGAEAVLYRDFLHARDWLGEEA